MEKALQGTSEFRKNSGTLSCKWFELTDFTYDENNSANLNFENCVFKGVTHLEARHVTLNQCRVEGVFEIKNTQSFSGVRINGKLPTLKRFYGDGQNDNEEEKSEAILRVEFSDKQGNNSFSVDSVSFGSLLITSSNIGSSHVKAQNSTFNNIELKNLVINQLIIKNLIGYSHCAFLMSVCSNHKDTSTLQIDSSHFKSFTLSSCDFYNTNMKIAECYFEEKVNLGESLQTVQLCNCKWQDNLKFQINGSFFNEECFQDSFIPKIVVVGDNFQTKQNTYRTLRGIAEKQKDRINALYYYKMEMEAYWQVLKRTKNKNLQEKVTVGTQMVLSDFGNSWWRPLWISFFFSFIFTPLIILERTNLEFTTKFNWDTLYLWLYLLNPTHKGEVDFMGSKIVIFGFADVIYRILMGFMIFYILKGLRKYTYK